MSNKESDRYLANLSDELNGAALYQGLAGVEKDPKLAEIYRRMAEVEGRHAEKWADRLRAAGEEVPAFRPSWRTRMLVWLAGRLGVSAVLPTVTEMEDAGSRGYQEQPDATDMVADERSHARVLRHIAQTETGGISGGALAKVEGRHRSAGGNALRAAVLGANDGLVSNLSLVMGVAGAELEGNAILVTGLAGLLAGACSMALGEWLSVQSSRELYQRQIEIEKAEIEAAPEEEAEELALIYQTRGLDQKQARQIANQVMSDQENALETLVREELGIDPANLGGSAREAAITSFLLFAIGAILPVVPFMFLGGHSAVALSILLGVVGLGATGAGITLFTGRSILFSSGRQIAFGLGAAAITYGLGRLIGASLAG